MTDPVLDLERGSPPRAWGGLVENGLLLGESRLTPTCVGRTSAPGRVASAPTAHPHVRGEDHTYAADTHAPTGSPPRAWGGRMRFDSRPWDDRLTPTCVGRTSGEMQCRSCCPAHPHVRGEDSARLRAAS